MDENRFRILWGALIALSVVFGLQLIRVLIPLFLNFLRDSQGYNALSLAPIALGIFALSFLAAPLRRLAGLRTALLITAGGAALFRVFEQLSSSSTLDLIAASAGTVLFLMFIPVALESARPRGAPGTSHFALAFLLGLTADTAIHTGAWTVDLSWQRGVLPLLIVIALAILAFAFLWQLLKENSWPTSLNHPTTGWGWARILALMAIGPFLFLQLVVFQNVARMAAISGWSLPVAGLVISLGNVIALMAAAHAPRSRRIPGLTVMVAIIFVALLLFINTVGILGAIVSVASQVLAASLITILLLSSGWLARSSGRMGAPAANGIGQILFVILTFLFYVTFDMSLGFRAPALLPVAGILLVLSVIGINLGLTVEEEEPRSDYQPVLAGVILLSIPLFVWFTWDTPEATTPPTDNTVLRIMDYNLHNGFNTDGQLDLETLAQVIEEANPDVLGLQEVSRGWVINGSVDMAQWLSHRLKMPYIFDPTEGAQWGNAILSRYPIVSTDSGPLPVESIPIRRGYVLAEIDAGGDRLQVIDTHLHHFTEDSEIRQEQVPALIEAWNGDPLTVLMGDFNATPDSPEMQAVAEAGLVDLAAEIGPNPSYTYYSADPNRQIDYIWASNDLTALDFNIPQTTASDHLPLVTVISLP